MAENVFSFEPEPVDAPWTVGECIEDLAGWLTALPGWLEWDGRRFVMRDDGRAVDLVESLSNIFAHVGYNRAATRLRIDGRDRFAALLTETVDPLLTQAREIETGEWLFDGERRDAAVERLRRDLLRAVEVLNEMEAAISTEKTGEPPPASHGDRVKLRRKLAKQLRREHATGNDWVQLAAILNTNPEYLAMGLDEAVPETVRNDCEPRPRTRRYRR